MFETQSLWNSFCQRLQWKSWYNCHFCSSFPTFDDLLSQGWEPKEGQLYAEHDWGPNRVCPVILRVPPSPPTANFQIIFSGTVAIDGRTLKRVCVYVHDKEVGGRFKDSTAKALHLWGNAPKQNWYISQIKPSMMERWNWFWCLFSTFFVLNQHIRRRIRSHDDGCVE